MMQIDDLYILFPFYEKFKQQSFRHDDSN